MKSSSNAAPEASSDSAFDYDLFVIGAGSGGVRASRFAAALGARVAVAEQGRLGGTCVNVGCIPKKLLSYAAHYAEDFEHASGFGWDVQAESAAPPGFDWPRLIANKDREIERLNGVYQRILNGAGVEILQGRATLSGPHGVQVAGRRITARHILLATGGWPTRPNFPGADLAITSNEAFALAQLPRRAVVIGGGYIAVEFASIFNGLGVDTTLIYRGQQLLREFDADLGRVLAEEMQKKGVDIRFGRTIENLQKNPAADSLLLAQLDDGSTLQTDLVLAATGRHANTAQLGLTDAGVALSADGAVLVDAQFQTNVPSIHAIGDVIQRYQLTPVALAEGMVVAERLFGKAQRSMDYQHIPTAVFSHPNVATVGLSESQAIALQGDAGVDIYQSSFRALRHTLSGSEEKTFMKLVVARDSQRVLGVHMVGEEAGEIIQGFAVALKCGATKPQFDATIGIHPTAAEEFVTMRELRC